MLKQFNKVFWILLKNVGNLAFAILLLLIIAICSSLGTFIEQDKVASFYELNYPLEKPIFGFIDFRLILYLGLDHIYQTWWFILLLIVFAMSLISCTFSRQLPSLKLAQIWQIYKNAESLQKFELNYCIPNVSLSKLTSELEKNQYKVLQQSTFVYAYKGLIGKIGPIIVHASMIIILFGSMLGNLTGFIAQELVPLGGIFHLQNIIYSGPFSYVNQNIEGYINDFKITYGEDGSIDQFYSDLTIMDKGENANKKTIYVNEPLRYKGITFYQTDWGVVGLIFQVDDLFQIEIPLKLVSSGTGKFWIANLPLKSNDLFIIIEDLTGKFQIYDRTKFILLENEIGSQCYINGHILRLTDIITSTGLQIKSDPGVPFVYCGFTFLIFSVFLSYISYSQIWAIKKGQNVYISGRTNRSTYLFEQDFIKFLSKLQS